MKENIKYTMPLLTEKQRKELMEELEEVIKAETHSVYGITARIALAALTAEPELWEIINPGEGTFYSPHGPRDFEEVEKLWYPTSPVPMLHAVDAWIKCSERMPEVGQEVILFNGIVRSGYYYTEYGDFSDVTEDCFTIGNATHWMPLPVQPEITKSEIRGEINE